MILSFKPQFQSKILDGSKIHTIREDSRGRWKRGRKIHFATGVRTKNYNCFREGYCHNIQAISIDPVEKQIHVGMNGKMNLVLPQYHQHFAQNDGFESEDEFWKWFDKPFYGKIIHWTNFLYN